MEFIITENFLKALARPARRHLVRVTKGSHSDNAHLIGHARKEEMLKTSETFMLRVS